MNSDGGYSTTDGWLQLIRNDKARTCGGQSKPSAFHVKRAQTDQIKETFEPSDKVKHARPNTRFIFRDKALIQRGK